MAEDGTGVTTVGVDWPTNSTYKDFAQWMQRKGAKREAGVNGLGWQRPLELYRPLLSYDELGGLLEAGPSKLFDKIDAILGIERAKDAQDRLTEAAKAGRQHTDALKVATRELKKELADVSDGRAVLACVQLAKYKPDIEAVRALASGTSTEADDDLAVLRRLAELQIPSAQETSDAVAQLRSALAELAQVRAASVERLELRSGLLHDALQLHEQAGDSECPVCGQGVLDGSWRQRVEEELAAERAEIGRLREARRAAQKARSDVHAILGRVAEPDAPDRLALETLSSARSACEKWSTAPQADDEMLCVHIETSYGELERTAQGLREESAALLAEREDLWRPYATQLSRWADLADEAKSTAPRLRLLKTAADFATSATERLRDIRLEGLETGAREIWAALRQESNVDLGSISLRGRGK